MNNEVTAKLLVEFSQHLDKRQPTTAVKAARPSRMSIDGCVNASAAGDLSAKRMLFLCHNLAADAASRHNLPVTRRLTKVFVLPSGSQGCLAG